MQKLIAVVCVALVFVSGCVTAKAVTPPPVLATVDTKENQTNVSKGGPLEPNVLYVCMDIDGRGMTCIDYQLFMQNLQEQVESSHPTTDL